MKHTTGRKVALLALALLLGAGSALGQTTTASGGTDPNKKDNTIRPPTPTKPDEPPYVMTYLGGIVCVGLLALAALIPSKRGHQD
jgi:hypothetical protein